MVVTNPGPRSQGDSVVTVSKAYVWWMSLRLPDGTVVREEIMFTGELKHGSDSRSVRRREGKDFDFEKSVWYCG